MKRPEMKRLIYRALGSKIMLINPIELLFKALGEERGELKTLTQKERDEITEAFEIVRSEINQKAKKV